jgi:hypothetical protein
MTPGDDNIALEDFAGVQSQHFTAPDDQVRLCASCSDLAQVH